MADLIYSRIAERHIHIDKISIEELKSFWPCLEWTLQYTLGDRWAAVEAGMYFIQNMHFTHPIHLNSHDENNQTCIMSIQESMP